MQRRQRNGAAGGNGGEVIVLGTLAPSQVASASAKGGAGSPNGNAGRVVIDNVEQP